MVARMSGWGGCDTYTLANRGGSVQETRDGKLYLTANALDVGHRLRAGAGAPAKCAGTVEQACAPDG